MQSLRRSSHDPPRGAACGERGRHKREDNPEAAASPSYDDLLRSEFRYFGNGLGSKAKGAHRPGYVLYLLLAEVIEGDR